MAASRFQWNKGDKILFGAWLISNLSMTQATGLFDEHHKFTNDSSSSAGKVFLPDRYVARESRFSLVFHYLVGYDHPKKLEIRG